MFSEKAARYFRNLTAPPGLYLDGVEIMNPYESEGIKSILSNFYNKYYADDNQRLFILGINPGRFGGGLTGISFTDPVALRKFCGIENDLGDKRELSSDFIYRVIDAFGGPERFFKKCFLSAQFPLALVKDGKNYNFYDDKETFKQVLPHIITSVKKQAAFGSRKDKVISLGSKNAEILRQVNDKLKIFGRVEVLDHPRYIMQYRRKHLDGYIKKYMDIIET